MSGLLVARRGSLHRSRAATNAYAAEVLADSPIAYWRFEETSGSTVADEVGSNDGTVYGANLNVSGPAATGSAASFDGTDDYILTGLNGPSGSSARTVEFMAKTTNTTTTLIAVGWGPDSPGERMLMGIRDNGNLWVAISYAAVQWDAPSLRDGNWHHIAFAMGADPDLSNMLAYYDGAQMTVAEDGGTEPINTAADPVYIATWSGGTSHFDGPIDEVAIYDKQLSASRILAHYNAGFA